MLLLRIISLFFVLFSFLFSDVNIYGAEVKEINNTIIIKNPVIVYKGIFIQAKEGVIIDNKKAVLKKDVVIFYNDEKILADKIEIFSKEHFEFKELFLYDSKSDVWFKSKEGKLKKGVFALKDIQFSSCCVENPDWFLLSKKAFYNKKKKSLKLYNIILYLNQTPVLYMPFYYTSFDKRRRSGLLKPVFGISNKEGFLYSQPVYFVLGEKADFEITPTIRTLRGYGIYNKLRFVDSPYSYGEIEFGGFKDKSEYVEENDLAYTNHYGYSVLYKRSRVFEDDELYVSLKYAKDVDYFYLNAYNYAFDTSYLVDKLITSKINYIKNINNDYIFGLYAKYFIDTTKKSNDDTLQILPQFNFHKFEKEDFGFLLNSFDINFYNYYSKSAQKYYLFNILAPLSLNFRFFDDYLKLKLTQTINYISANTYFNSPEYFFQSYSSIKFFTSLAKKTNSYFHSIDPYIILNIKNISKISDTQKYLRYTKVNNNIEMGVFEIFENPDFYIEHTLKQSYDLDVKKKTDLYNDITVLKEGLTLKDTLKYSWDLYKVVYNYVEASTNIGEYYFKLSNLYQAQTDITEAARNYIFRAEKKINYKKLYFEYNYDMLNKYVKYFLLGVRLNKKCWQYDLNIKKTRNPVLKESGISYRDDYTVNFMINLYPLGGVQQLFQIKGKE